MSDETKAASPSCTLNAEDRRDLLRAMLKMLGHALASDARLEDMDAKELYEYMAMMQRVA